MQSQSSAIVVCGIVREEAVFNDRAAFPDRNTAAEGGVVVGEMTVANRGAGFDDLDAATSEVALKELSSSSCDGESLEDGT